MSGVGVLNLVFRVELRSSVKRINRCFLKPSQLAPYRQRLYCIRSNHWTKSASGTCVSGSGRTTPKRSWWHASLLLYEHDKIFQTGLGAKMADQQEPVLLDGKATAGQIRQELKQKCDTLKANNPSHVPGLAFVLVGSRTDSATYVRMKKRACEEVGIQTHGHELDESVSEEELVKLVRDLNANKDVHGILVQLPLPSHINERRVLDEISVQKDVDGLHPYNIGSLVLRGCEPSFVACTPLGCMELLRRYNIPIRGKRAVVIGRSNIVGLPMSQLLLKEDATVTCCHSKTEDIASYVREADILVAAIGKAEFVKGSWLKPGAVVIDVGMNRVDDETKQKGYRLVGDVEQEECRKRASAITPVPGGVGPMTIAMLLNNTVSSAMTMYSS